jgi:hypothetical protein
MNVAKFITTILVTFLYTSAFWLIIFKRDILLIQIFSIIILIGGGIEVFVYGIIWITRN